MSPEAPCATLSPGHVQRLTLPDSLALECGRMLGDVTICFESWGKLSENRDNVVLICHALTGDSHVARHGQGDRPGWWDLVVGPGKYIDTDRYCVICSNVLGGCSGTTGPGQVDPTTHKPFGTTFPPITIFDMVAAQAALCDALGIERLHAVVGGSMGGHQALAWATRFGSRVKNCLVIASSPRLSSQALSFDIIGRNAILRDPHFAGGQYYDEPHKPGVGLALARMLAHITYLSRDGMTSKFESERDKPRDIDSDFEKIYGVGSYLAHQGNKFIDRFDANSYVSITRAEDAFDLGEGGDVLAERFGEETDAGTRFGIVSFSSDWLFPPTQSRQMVEGLSKAGRRVSYVEITSDAGHDAFLLPDQVEQYGGFIQSMLEGSGDVDSPSASHVNVFAAHRLDYDTIVDLIPPTASVLDLGCGDGGLLDRLRQRGERPLAGVDVTTQNVLAGVARGLDVIDADLNQPLTFFADGQFDVVVLSQALQSIDNTIGVLHEVLRVGRSAIVSFPNFAYGPLRDMLYDKGRSPKDLAAYGYEWYDTPNRRHPTILDFLELCDKLHLDVRQAVYLDTFAGKQVAEDDEPNRKADLAVMVLAKAKDAGSD